MKACSGAHHWARLFAQHGHMVRLIAPKFVARYRMSGPRGKNDAADAAAICEAVRRPAMRFVPVKSLEQHARLMVHRARQGYLESIPRADERARQLMRLSGVGPTSATAILAMIGNGHEFKCGRQFAAWLGLAPGQPSSGGKTRLAGSPRPVTPTCARS
jgi:transposase